MTGTNLYSDALAAKGLTAFALVGRRAVALLPERPDRQAPAAAYLDSSVKRKNETEVQPVV